MNRTIESKKLVGFIPNSIGKLRELKKKVKTK